MSNCSCVYSEYDPMTCYSQIERRARKPHTCCECGREIERKEWYWITSGVYEDEWSKYKTCGDCKQVEDEFFCDGYEFGQIWNLLDEHLRTLSPEFFPYDCIAKLSPRARKMVCELIERIWGCVDDDDDDDDDEDS